MIYDNKTDSEVKPLFQSELAIPPHSMRRRRRSSFTTTSTSSLSLPQTVATSCDSSPEPVFAQPHEGTHCGPKRQPTATSTDPELVFDDLTMSTPRTARPRSVQLASSTPAHSSIEQEGNTIRWFPVLAPDGLESEYALVPIAHIRKSMDMGRPQHNELFEQQKYQDRRRYSVPSQPSVPAFFDHNRGQQVYHNEPKPKLLQKIKKRIRTLFQRKQRGREREEECGSNYLREHDQINMPQERNKRYSMSSVYNQQTPLLDTRNVGSERPDSSHIVYSQYPHNSSLYQSQGQFTNPYQNQYQNQHQNQATSSLNRSASTRRHSMRERFYPVPEDLDAEDNTGIEQR